MEITKWLTDITPVQNWIRVIQLMIWALLGIINYKVSSKKEKAEQRLAKTNEQLKLLNKSNGVQNETINRLNNKIKSHDWIVNYLNKTVLKAYQNINIIINSPVVVKAEGYTYRSYNYKKESGATIEKKEGGKKRIVKGIIGYLVNDKYFISKESLELQFERINKTTDAILVNNEVNSNFDKAFKIIVEEVVGYKTVEL